MPAELKSYTPTLRERMAAGLGSLFGDNRAAYRTGERLTEALDLTPVGLATMMYDAGRMGAEGYQTGSMGSLFGGGALAMAGMLPMARKPAQQAVKGIRAYHVSPHDFDRFSMDKIGTGEGAQAYGHGLYFAENPKVSGGPDSEYWKAFADEFVGKKDASGNLTSEAIATNALLHSQGDRQGALKFLYDPKYNQKETLPDNFRGAVDLLESDKPIGPRNYEVNIKADPEDFLDWDKPLSEQPQALRDVLLGADLSHLPPGGRLRRTIEAHRKAPGDWVPPEGANIPEPTGNQIHSALTDYGNSTANNAALTDKMREAGIPGIKYLDQGSRGAGGEGTRNYVLFRDDIVEIVKKYGIAGAAALTGMSQADITQAAQQAQAGQGLFSNPIAQ